jgi:Transposase, Mutator family
MQLVIADAHTRLKAAIGAVMGGACWQRCRVHFLRNVLARVPKGSAEVVAAAIRTIFAATGQEVLDQVGKVAAMLQPKFPALATMLADAREDLTAFCHFPSAHWVKIWSMNPLERVNKEIKRRTDVVGGFPDPERFAAGRGGAGRDPRPLAGGRAGATTPRDAAIHDHPSSRPVCHTADCIGCPRHRWSSDGRWFLVHEKLDPGEVSRNLAFIAPN